MPFGVAALVAPVANARGRLAPAQGPNGGASRVGQVAVTSPQTAAEYARSLKSQSFRDRRTGVRGLHRGSSERETAPRRWSLREFAALCTAAAGARARGRRSRLRSAATATIDESPAALKGPLGKLFAPIAFRQWTNWATELGAGVTTAVVALPLAMAFGVTSGAGALAGLYGAIFSGFFAALFGGTPAQVTGPTGPMAVVMALVVAKYPDPSVVFTVVAMAGLMQIVMGMLKLGGAIRLVPRTVLSGFMTGIGGIICSLQMPVMLGHSGGGQVINALKVLPFALASPNLCALAIGIFTLFMLYKFPARFTCNIPRPLLALVAASTASAVLGLSVPSLGAIPQGLPALTLPAANPALLAALVPTALTLAVLGAVDSLLTSLVADSMTSSFHDSDRELVGQGIGNTVAGIFGGHAGAGATMRTVVNVRTGGRTPISGAAHSVVLFAAVLGLGSLARFVPLSCLAAILIKSGLDVVDWPLLKKVSALPRPEVAILAVTFLMTVFVDLIIAVVAGWSLAILVYFYKASQLQLGARGVQVFDSASASAAPEPIREVVAAADAGTTSVVQLKGQVAFGAAVGLLRQLVPEVVGKKTVIVDLSEVVMMDASAVLCLEELLEKVAGADGKAYVCGAQRDMDGFELLGSLDLARSASNGSTEDKLTAGLLAA